MVLAVAAYTHWSEERLVAMDLDELQRWLSGVERMRKLEADAVEAAMERARAGSGT